MTSPDSINQSPTWGRNFKLIVGFTIVAFVAAFLIRFHAILPPLLLTFILIYLLRPIIIWISDVTPLSWRWAVNITFIFLIIFILAAFTLVGVAVVQQMQSLINIIDRFINNLPDMITDFSSKAYMIGPFRVDISQYLSASNLEALVQQFLSVVQPMLGQAGSLLGTVATGTVSFFGWAFFILLVSYFILADMGKVPDELVELQLPGYGYDVRRIGRELSRIWNAFLRGQIIMFTISLVVYTILFAILGVRYFLALALVSGLARFVPYVGQWVNWAVLILVTVFQKSNYFGLESWQYVILVAAFVFVVDQIFDNVISPRILGRSMGVHPAAVLVAAIIGFSLLGIVGVILAAPGLATVTMLGRYISRKMLDLDPWPQLDHGEDVMEYPWKKLWQKLLIWMRAIWERLKTKFT